MSISVYEQAQESAAGPRDREYKAFASSTRGLLEADARRGDLKIVAQALHVNRSLWEALAADCARDDNALPMDLRARIVALSRWVGDYSRLVLRGKGEIDALVDVNKIMMDGLAGRRGE
ncbi:MAG: flagellar biosynthesis regulator FlaF [Pseudomonadota bacterium]